jgi:DNA-binding MarR family transcriptional regulator
MKSLRLIPGVHRATHRIGLYLAGAPAATLSQGESHILALLAQASPLTIRALHEGLAHKPSTLTSILDRLSRRGLVTRAVGESDRRTFVVTLTAKGRRVARQILRQLIDLERAVTSQVSDVDLAGFSKVLSAIESEAHQRASMATSASRRRRAGRRPSSTM